MCALVTGVQTCVLPILVSISYGPLALEYILATGGSGYFRKGFVRSYLEEGRLALVPDSPEFSYSAYVVHSTKADKGVLDRIRRSEEHTSELQSLMRTSYAVFCLKTKKKTKTQTTRT